MAKRPTQLTFRCGTPRYPEKPRTAAMTLATSTAWSVPGGSSVMPATEMSPHGLLIAPARVQPASIRSLGAVRGRGARRLVDSSWATGALALSAAALATDAVAAAAEPFAAVAVVAAAEPFAAVAVAAAAEPFAAVAVAAAAEPFATVAVVVAAAVAAAAEPFAALVAIAAGRGRLDPKWLNSDGRHSRASAGLVGALEPPKRSGSGT